MYRNLETENATQWATACRPFLIGHESDIYKETRTIHGREEKIGLPALLITGIEGISYCNTVTGLEDRSQTPVWQILLRSKDEAAPETALLYGRVTRTAEDWRLLYEDRQGIKTHEAFVIDKKGVLADFVLLALEKSNIRGISKKLLDKKSAALRKHDNYVRDNPQGIDKTGQRVNGSAELFGQYSRIKFQGQGVIDLRHVRQPAVIRGAAPKKVDVSDIPDWINNAVSSTSFEARASYSVPQKIRKKR